MTARSLFALIALICGISTVHAREGSPFEDFWDRFQLASAAQDTAALKGFCIHPSVHRDLTSSLALIESPAWRQNIMDIRADAVISISVADAMAADMLLSRPGRAPGGILYTDSFRVAFVPYFAYDGEATTSRLYFVLTTEGYRLYSVLAGNYVTDAQMLAASRGVLHAPAAYDGVPAMRLQHFEEFWIQFSQAIRDTDREMLLRMSNASEQALEQVQSNSMRKSLPDDPLSIHYEQTNASRELTITADFPRDWSTSRPHQLLKVVFRSGDGWRLLFFRPDIADPRSFNFLFTCMAK